MPIELKSGKTNGQERHITHTKMKEKEEEKTEGDIQTRPTESEN